MTSTGSRICTLIMEIQDAFLDTPSLALSLPETEQRFGADPVTCEAILAALVDARVLAQTKTGAYESTSPQLHPRLRFPHATSPVGDAVNA